MALLRKGPNCSLLLALFCVPLLARESTSQALSEAQVKAAMVYNFAFTEGPEVSAAGRPLVGGVLGNDGLAKALKSMGRLSDGRDVEVRMLGESKTWPAARSSTFRESRTGPPPHRWHASRRCPC